MPKLSKKTLDKMFQCPHCGHMFRTRQGLSGHIRFKHDVGTKSAEEKIMNDDLTKVAIEAMEKSKKDGEDLARMALVQAEWHFFKKCMEIGNIKLSDADFKQFLIVGAAAMYGNQRLMSELANELGSAIGQLIKKLCPNG